MEPSNCVVVVANKFWLGLVPCADLTLVHGVVHIPGLVDVKGELASGSLAQLLVRCPCGGVEPTTGWVDVMVFVFVSALMVTFFFLYSLYCFCPERPSVTLNLCFAILTFQYFCLALMFEMNISPLVVCLPSACQSLRCW